MDTPGDYLRRHGLETRGLQPASAGTVNRVFMTEAHVLRVGKGQHHPREARLALAALRAGVRTARPVAWGEGYSIWERLKGSSVDRAKGCPLAVWHALLDDLEILHAHPLEPRSPVPDWRADPNLVARTQEAAGWRDEERDLLTRAFSKPHPVRNPAFIHGDAYGDNVLVSNGTYVGLIDWGCAGWGPLEAECAPLEDEAFRLALKRPDGLDLNLLWKLRLHLLLSVASLGRVSFETVRAALGEASYSITILPK